jgi:tetratricopeptide (TPR) repeat protein
MVEKLKTIERHQNYLIKESKPIKKKYSKAIEYFTETYKIDPKNIDALYNKAAVFFESGDTINACNVWQEISKLGQVSGGKMYQDYCK